MRVLLHGCDESLTGDVAAHLIRLGHEIDVASDEADLFSEVVASRAEAVIGVLGLRGEFQASSALAEVRALIAASRAPKPPIVILVTAGPLDGEAPHLKELKRSGAAYVVIHVPQYDELPPIAYLTGKSVLVSDEFDRLEHGIVTRASLLAQITQALSEDGQVGVIVSLPKTSLSSYLRSSDVGVRSVPNWLARWSAKLGVPALYLDRAGQLRGRWGVEEAASALGVQVPSARGVITPPSEGRFVSRMLVDWAVRVHSALRSCLKRVGFDRSAQLTARTNDGQT